MQVKTQSWEGKAKSRFQKVFGNHGRCVLQAQLISYTASQLFLEWRFCHNSRSITTKKKKSTSSVLPYNMWHRKESGMLQQDFFVCLFLLFVFHQSMKELKWPLLYWGFRHRWREWSKLASNEQWCCFMWALNLCDMETIWSVNTQRFW